MIPSERKDNFNHPSSLRVATPIDCVPSRKSMATKPAGHAKRPRAEGGSKAWRWRRLKDHEQTVAWQWKEGRKVKHPCFVLPWAERCKGRFSFSFFFLPSPCHFCCFSAVWHKRRTGARGVVGGSLRWHLHFPFLSGTRMPVIRHFRNYCTRSMFYKRHPIRDIVLILERF